MSTSLKDLLTYLNQQLQPHNFKDYCPNGLQVQGKDNIKKIVTGVTASQALLDAAVAQQADAILVHHGYFWKGEAAEIIGMKQQRLKTLLTHDINLIAYHLPLDAHLELGNNIQLAKQLNIINPTAAVDNELLFQGELNSAQAANDFANHIEQQLQRKPLHIAGTEKPIQRVAWCTGGAQDYITDAAELGVDAFISGEVSERTFHIAQELQIHYFAAGHHATERYGIKALGEHLTQHFGFEQQFIDIDNPV